MKHLKTFEAVRLAYDVDDQLIDVITFDNKVDKVKDAIKSI